MTKDNDIFGVFVSGPTVIYDWDQAAKDKASAQGALFRDYIWGADGISNNLKKLKHKDYGNDLELVLFQFYLNPLPIELQQLKEIESYKRKEKAIGVPIVVTNEDFFSKNEDERDAFLKRSILQKMELLEDVIKRNQLDTKIELLKSDLLKTLI
jgi:hypothetical protein